MIRFEADSSLKLQINIFQSEHLGPEEKSEVTHSVEMKFVDQWLRVLQ